MSTDFSEGEPPKGGPPPTARPTGISETAPEKAPAPPPREIDHDREHDRRVGELAQDSDDRIVAIIAHWAGGFTWIFAPLVMYIVQTDKRSLAAWHAREALNFQITITLYSLLPTPLACLSLLALADQSPLWIVLGTVLPLGLLGLVATYELAMLVWASIAAYQGNYFKIPLNIPFIRRPALPSSMDDHADFE